MDDLRIENNKITLLCIFINQSDMVIKKVSEMSKSDSKIVSERAKLIANILNAYINGADSFSSLFEKIGLIEDDEKVNSLVYNTKLQVANNDQLLDDLTLKLKLITNSDEKDFKVVLSEDHSFPIHPEELYFLNRLANTNLEDRKYNSFKEEDFNHPGIKSKLIKLHNSVPYYFEQAFSNTTVLVQQKVLKIISDKLDKNNSEQLKEYEKLLDLNFLSNIDDLILKIKSPNSQYQAANKIITLLSQNNKHNLITNILKENVILKELFTMNNSKSGSNFQRLFINSSYPYNEIILNKYKRLMKKNEEEMAIIINDLSDDVNFKEAYQKYLNATNSIRIKNYIENFFEKLSSMEPTKIKDGIVSIIDILMRQHQFNSDIISSNNCEDYINDIKRIVFKYKLNFDEKINKKIDEYLIYKIGLESDSKSVKKSEETIYGITPIDFWYEIKKLMLENEIKEYDIVYLKYNEKYSYEFSLEGEFKLTDKDLSLREIKNLNPNEACIICSDGGDSKFNTTNLVINRIYQRIFKVILFNKLIFKIDEPQKKSFLNKQMAIFTEADAAKIRRIINDYSALRYILSKDRKFFKELYSQRIRSILTDIIDTNLKFPDIDKNVTLVSEVDYLNIFRDKLVLNDLLQRYNAPSMDINEHIEVFLNLVEPEKQKQRVL